MNNPLLEQLQQYEQHKKEEYVKARDDMIKAIESFNKLDDTQKASLVKELSIASLLLFSKSNMTRM